MRTWVNALLALAIIFIGTLGSLSADDSGVYSFTVEDISGKPTPLSVYKGKVLLIVNTASRCGFTSQYNELEELYKRYKESGLEILGFPSNDFGNQEPGSNAEIQEFCKSKFGVTFPMFAKNSVRGEDKQPLYAYLTTKTKEDLRGEIEWNFEKFIVDRRGNVRGRFGSFTNPMSSRIIEKVEVLLNEASEPGAKVK